MAHQRKTKNYRIQLAYGQGSLRDSLERWIRQAAVENCRATRYEGTGCGTCGL